MKGKSILALALALTMSLSLTGCKSSSTQAEASVQSVAMLMGVEISGVNQYSGVTEARSTVKVNKDANKTVKECFVEAGDQVKKGDKLFAYDTDALELTVTSAELEVEQLRNSITNYETQITSLEKDKKKAPSSEKLSYTLQIQEAQLSKSESEYNLKQKEAELQKLKNSAGETEVLSPVDGVVQSVQKEDDSSQPQMYGPNVDNSGGAYITIMETGTYRIKGTASEESIRGLSEGMEMTAYSRQDPAQSWHGVIDSVNTGSAESQGNDNGNYYDGSNGEGSSKYAFYVALDHSDGLLIGQHVYLKPGAGAGDDNAIRLPSGYLVIDGDSASVWAADSKDKLEKRSVTLGEYDEESDEYIIAEGLALTDYIAYPDESLSAGMKVVRYDESSFGGGEEYAEGGEAPQGEGGFAPEEGEGFVGDVVPNKEAEAPAED